MTDNWMEERMVCAVEALVEEQRTANLISALSANLPTGAGPVAHAEAYSALRAEIRARLGITPTTPNQEQ